MIDVRAERLCEPDGREPTLGSQHYLFEGGCRPLYRRVDEWMATPTGGAPGPPRPVRATVLRTVHGPVLARGTVGGRPVVFTTQRSTFMRELDSLPGFALLNVKRVTGPGTFRRAVGRVTASFNWLYVDDRDVAYFHSGRYPLRARGVNPNLPSWGTGRWEWRGVLPFERHPQTVDPAQGWIASWNNKPAKGWRAPDENWSWGSVQRVDLLTRRFERRPTRELAIGDVVKITADAATVDLRGREVVPAALRLLGRTDGLARYVRILREWVREGAHRSDSDGDGDYDQPQAVALMDAWWPRLIQSIFRNQLSGLYRFVPVPFEDPGRTSGLGSAFREGYYGVVQKAVRMALGRQVARPFRRLRCARGDTESCRGAILRSLRAAVRTLGQDPRTWHPSPSRDAITFTPTGLITVPDIAWQNRPAFQQVVSVARPRSRA